MLYPWGDWNLKVEVKRKVVKGLVLEKGDIKGAAIIITVIIVIIINKKRRGLPAVIPEAGIKDKAFSEDSWEWGECSHMSCIY